MKPTILSRVFGHLLADGEGLSVAYLPDGLSAEFGADIVRAANQNRRASPPYSILVTGREDDLLDPECPKVSSQSAIRYRQGSRLAVVVGRHPDLASFVQAFREVLGQDFPKSTSGRPTLESIASASIDTILSDAGRSDASYWDKAAAVRRLADCLADVGKVQEELRQGVRAWNAFWFENVSDGLQRLFSALTDAARDEPELSLDEVFKRYTYAAFGLPFPKTAGRLRSAKAVVEAYDRWWGDEERLRITAQQLDHHPETDSDQHSMSKVDWSDFDKTIAAQENPLSAFIRYGDGQETVYAIAGLSENQFTDPQNTANRDGELIIVSVQGEDRTLPDRQGEFVLGTLLPGQPLSRLESETVRIRVPLLAPIDSVDGSGLSLRAHASKTNWEGVLELDDAGDLWCVGSFIRTLGRAPFTYSPRAVSISITVEASDPLAGCVDSSAACVVYLMPPAGPGILYWPETRKRRTSKASYLGPTKFNGDGTAIVSDSPFSVELQDTSNPYHLTLWASEGGEPYVDGAAATPLPGFDKVWHAQLPSGGPSDVRVDGYLFEFSNAEPKSPFQSPIVAAVHKQRIGGAGPGPDIQNSVRGSYETFVCSALDSEHDGMLLEALGHVCLPADRGANFTNLSLRAGMLMDESMGALWANISDFTVSEEIRSSAEADAFRHAFESLEVPKAALTQTSEGAEFTAWPSRTSWRHLWEKNSGRAALHRYLDAYSELVEAARTSGDAEAVFWAAYPFSVSVWSTEGAVECQSVLLSPLHPIRLAWVAGVESTLWNASRAEELAGTIEGWNLPLLGPRDSAGDRMIAVPTDGGEGQVFLGWSMLVGASIGAPKPLDAPQEIGSFMAPGNAASGLNATAAAAALRNYRKMNPQVNTLTIDLAAANPTSRLAEVDEAVLAAIKEWSTGSPATRLRGGARVWDSLNRGGQAPRDAVTRLVREFDDVPLTWSRYRSANDGSQPCNIRILQDSGVYVGIGTDGPGNYGVMGPTPLRRLEAHRPPTGGARRAESYPALRSGTGWEPFTRALSAFEGAIFQPKVISRLFRALLVDGTADWTVSGEALMNPSAMAELIKTSTGGKQMLWEWRPPFLEKSRDIPALERRPFVSVTRVPSGFREQVRLLLTKAEGSAATDSSVDELLGQLGARGVGLSSLLSMGGTHASGALGFYLAFGLMDTVDSEGAEHFVLPIDACDTFLRALSKGATHSANVRRADLLVLTLRDNSITLTPIEIKFYGLGATPSGNRTLPSRHNSLLDEAADQLTSTMELLSALKSRWEDLETEIGGHTADRVLWANAMATLVETGIRLTPRSSPAPDVLADRLEQIVSGKMNIDLGRPLVTYFKHDGETETGAAFEVFNDSKPRLGAYGALVCNAGAAFKQLNYKESDITKGWKGLVEWATASDECASKEETSEVTETTNNGVAVKNRSSSFVPAPVPARDDAPQISVETPDPGQADSHLDAPFEDAAGTDDGLKSGGNPEDPDSVQGIRGEGIKFPVGSVLSSVGHQDAVFWPGNTALNQMNVGVVGDLGTGKTQLLKALILQLRLQAKETQKTPVSTLIFDYKRDFQEQSFLDAVGGKLLRPQGIPLNIFALPNGYTKLAAYQRATAFTDILAKIYSGVGPVQRERLVGVIIGLYEEGGGNPPTLARVLEEYRSVSGTADSVTSMLSTFVYGEIFSDDPNHLVPFGDLLEDTVLVVALNDLGTDQNAKNALVVLFLNMYFDYMLQSPKWPYAEKNDGLQLRRLNSFLLVDEAVNIMRHDFPVLMDLMLQGREFGFGVILASQYLSHFRAGHANYGEPLLTWFIHKVPNVTSKELEQLGIGGVSKDTVERIARLKVHEALYKSFGFPGTFIRGTPFYEIS